MGDVLNVTDQADVVWRKMKVSLEGGHITIT